MPGSEELNLLATVACLRFTNYYTMRCKSAGLSGDGKTRGSKRLQSGRHAIRNANFGATFEGAALSRSAGALALFWGDPSRDFRCDCIASGTRIRLDLSTANDNRRTRQERLFRGPVGELVPDNKTKTLAQFVSYVAEKAETAQRNVAKRRANLPWGTQSERQKFDPNIRGKARRLATLSGDFELRVVGQPGAILAAESRYGRNR